MKAWFVLLAIWAVGIGFGINKVNTVIEKEIARKEVVREANKWLGPEDANAFVLAFDEQVECLDDPIQLVKDRVINAIHEYHSRMENGVAEWETNSPLDDVIHGDRR